PELTFTRCQSSRLSQMPSWASAEVVIGRSSPKAKVLALSLTVTVLGEVWTAMLGGSEGKGNTSWS
ncbi:hypothetical protein, partial [Klebsiella pneumoniae]|uniref:hypothetical protein n=1 Tax=Klebsiella pneumoniae TaxID=573 RepID=UPI0032DB6A65